MLDDFSAGTLELKNFINTTRTRKYNDFQTFLKTLEVYGCGFLDDIDKVKYRDRNTKSHEETTTDELYAVMMVYEGSMIQLKKLQSDDPTNESIVSNQLIDFLTFQFHCFSEIYYKASAKPKLTDFDCKT